MISCVLSANHAGSTTSGWGGALYVSGASSTIDCIGCYFTSNTVVTSGQDIYISGGSVTTVDCESGDGSNDGKLDTDGTTQEPFYNYNCGVTLSPTAVPTHQPATIPTLIPTAIPTPSPTSWTYGK